MALQTFTAGQILTAAQVTALQANDYNQTVSAKTGSYVLTAADKGTRITMSSASATTITVNTSLFAAGDSLRIQNLNGGGVCTITAGTATVTSAGPLAIPSWGGGQLFFTSASAAIWFPDAITVSSGLVCVKAETSFSGAASVTADGVFTSSYTNYMMWINYTTSGVNFMGAKLRASGTSNSANYTYQILQGFTTSATTSAVTAGSSQAVGYYSNSVDQISVVQIGNPQLAKRTSFVVANPGISGGLNYNIQGTHTTSSAYDGIELLMDTGTMTGTYAIYGYAKTV